MAQLVCISPDSFPRCGQISLIATLANLIVVSLMSGAVGVKLVLYSSAAGRIRQVTRDHQIQRHVVSAGDSILGFGTAGVVVLHPRASFVNTVSEAPEGLKNGSVVVKVSYEG